MISSSIKRSADYPINPSKRRRANEDLLTFLDLPKDILVDIISQKEITLEDRMNLRATCKTMESLIAQTDFRSSYFLEIKPSRSRSNARVTTICGLLDKASFKTPIPSKNQRAFTHLMSRLYHRARIGYLRITNFNFKPDAPNSLMSIDQLLQLSRSFLCERLFVFATRETYDPRMFEVINTIQTSNHLSLHLTDLIIELNHLMNLPAANALIISASGVAAPVTNSAFLSLITKYRSLDLSIGMVQLNIESLMEARQIVENRGDSLCFHTSYDAVEAMLGQLGITRKASGFRSTNPTIKIVTRHKTTLICRSKWEHSIEVRGTRIFFVFDYTSKASFDAMQKVKLKIEKIEDEMMEE